MDQHILALLPISEVAAVTLEIEVLSSMQCSPPKKTRVLVKKTEIREKEGKKTGRRREKITNCSSECYKHFIDILQVCLHIMNYHIMSYKQNVLTDQQ